MTARILPFRKPETKVLDIPKGWREFARWCSAHPEKLRGSEMFFVHSMSTWDKEPTEHQIWWLDLIYNRYMGPWGEGPDERGDVGEEIPWED